MDPELLQLFVREVDRQARYALRAAADLRNAVGSLDSDCVWYSIQGLLIATANISKLLWPSNKGASARGEALRKTLMIEDGSPLSSRKFRNCFEHFDERLDAWGISMRTHLVVDSNIGSIGSIKGGSSMFYMRHFDPSTETLIFHDEVYELRPVIGALEKLRSTTHEWSQMNQLHTAVFR